MSSGITKWRLHIPSPGQSGPSGQIGRRTGKDVLAGKNIRRDDRGMENFDDYWSDDAVEEASLTYLKEISKASESVALPSTPLSHKRSSTSLRENASLHRDNSKRSRPSIQKKSITPKKLFWDPDKHAVVVDDVPMLRLSLGDDLTPSDVEDAEPEMDLRTEDLPRSHKTKKTVKENIVAAKAKNVKKTIRKPKKSPKIGKTVQSVSRQLEETRSPIQAAAKNIATEVFESDNRSTKEVFERDKKERSPSFPSSPLRLAQTPPVKSTKSKIKLKKTKVTQKTKKPIRESGVEKRAVQLSVIREVTLDSAIPSVRRIHPNITARFSPPLTPVTSPTTSSRSTPPLPTSRIPRLEPNARAKLNQIMGKMSAKKTRELSPGLMDPMNLRNMISDDDQLQHPKSPNTKPPKNNPPPKSSNRKTIPARKSNTSLKRKSNANSSRKSNANSKRASNTSLRRTRTRTLNRTPASNRSRKSTVNDPRRTRNRPLAQNVTHSPAKNVNSQIKNVTRSPAQSKNVPRSPVKNVQRSPVENVPRSPVKSVTRGTVKNLMRSPVKNVTRSPVKNVTPSSVKSVTRPSASASRLHEDIMDLDHVSSESEVEPFLETKSTRSSRKKGKNIPKKAKKTLKEKHQKVAPKNKASRGKSVSPEVNVTANKRIREKDETWPQFDKLENVYDSGSGNRRSARTRVPRLAYWRNERIQYKRDMASGTYVIENVVGLDKTVVKQKHARPVKTKKDQKTIIKRTAAKTHHTESVATDNEDDDNMHLKSDILVVNPETGDTVFVDCVAPIQSCLFYGQKNQLATAEDPVTIAKGLSQLAFSHGVLYIRPYEEKGTSSVRGDTIIFSIFKGKLEVTIHETVVTLGAKDSFFVPRGNVYNIRNLGNKTAELWFTQLRG